MKQIRGLNYANEVLTDSQGHLGQNISERVRLLPLYKKLNMRYLTFGVMCLALLNQARHSLSVSHSSSFCLQQRAIDLIYSSHLSVKCSPLRLFIVQWLKHLKMNRRGTLEEIVLSIYLLTHGIKGCHQGKHVGKTNESLNTTQQLNLYYSEGHNIKKLLVIMGRM